MELEEEVIKFIAEQNSKELGVAAGVIAAFYWAYKKVSFFEKFVNKFWGEKAFEKYNDSIWLIYEKRTTYKFFAAQFKKDSYNLFQALKAIYDLESSVNINSKTLNFRMEELSESTNLFTNITRFLDYYKSRNGVKINLFLHSTEGLENTSSNIKESIQKYILDSKIHAVKVISGKYKE